MTREEAMKELSYIIDEMPSMECADWIEAISMGIKALEQEPCDDAISRQDAIDALYKMLHDCFWADDEELDAVITTLKDLPPVTAEKVVSSSEKPNEQILSIYKGVALSLQVHSLPIPADRGGE